MASITYWNRVEPRPRSDEILPALAARVRDPAWMLARQWQFGEFRGEDAGSPAFVRIAAEVTPLLAWRSEGDDVRPLDRTSPLERATLRESFSPADLSTTVELGQTFERLLRAAGAGDLASAYRAAYPIPDAADDDPRTARLRRLWRGRALDGLALYRAAKASSPSLPPPPVDPAREGILRTVIEDFVRWVDDVHGAPAIDDPAAWRAERLEYSLDIVAGAPVGGTALLAVHPARDGRLPWYSFDLRAEPAPQIPTPPVERIQRAVIPAHVRFRGMPNHRWWDFEDGRVDFGAVNPDKRDLAKLVLLDFMLVHGNDWFLVPFDQPVGTLCRLSSLIVRDVFGENTTVPRADAAPTTAGRWTMFSTARSDGAIADFFLVPSSSDVAIQEGRPREEVRFLRDEMANLTWAVEHATEGRLGEPILGHDRAVGGPAAAPIETDLPLRYQIQTGVPVHWIPFVPVSIDPARGEIALQLAATLAPGGAEGAPPVLPTPLGRILRPNRIRDATYTVREEEIPREGTQVLRVAHRTRWIDGSTHVWLARHRRVGTGEGWSGLGFDLALPGRPATR